MSQDDVRSGILGLAIGDALGVPVEFKTRGDLRRNPVRDMMGYGTYNQPPGAWSDDSAMAFCITEGLMGAYDLARIARNFVDWYENGFWRATPTMRDIGMTTRNAIWNLQRGISPKDSGLSEDNTQSNGSLMRTLPLALYLEKTPNVDKFPIVEEVSAITHAHGTCKVACSLYVQTAIHLLQGYPVGLAYDLARGVIPKYYEDSPLRNDLRVFQRVLDGRIVDLAEKEIQTGGGAVMTLEAALWCLLRNKDYSSTVLAAVNLGADTDTTAAVAGGLAGIAYGLQSRDNVKGIPSRWIEQLARKDDIVDLISRFAVSMGK